MANPIKEPKVPNFNRRAAPLEKNVLMADVFMMLFMTLPSLLILLSNSVVIGLQIVGVKLKVQLAQTDA